MTTKTDDDDVVFDPIEAVRSSCHLLSQLPNISVQVNPQGVDMFAVEIAQRLEELRSITSNSNNHEPPYHDPAVEWSHISFLSTEEELSAHATLHLLNIGHGHKKLLRENKLGRYKNGSYGSAYVTMLQGVGVAAQEGSITADRMEAWNMDETILCFGLPKDCLLAAQVTAVIQETGSILKRSGHVSLGSFVSSLVAKSSDTSNFVAEVVRLFPAFRDRVLYKDGETTLAVHLYKKAFLLVKDVANRFGPRNPVYRLQGISTLPVMADNVLPAVLRAKEVLRVTTTIPRDDIIPAGSKLETELRAVSVEACEQLVAAVNLKLSRDQSPITAAELDLWLWGVLGKEKGLCDAPRHFTPDTIFY